MYLLHAWSTNRNDKRRLLFLFGEGIRGDCSPHILKKYSVFWPCAFVTNYYVVSIRFRYPISHMFSLFELPNVPGKRHDIFVKRLLWLEEEVARKSLVVSWGKVCQHKEGGWVIQ